MGKPSNVYTKAIERHLKQDRYVKFVKKRLADIVISGTVSSVETGRENQLFRAGIKINLLLTPRDGDPAEFNFNWGKGLHISSMRAAGIEVLKQTGARNAREIVQSIMIMQTSE